MTYIPKNARWYLADVVLELAVEDDPRNAVHVNLHLIEAESPERAYEKAIALGQASEQRYTNADGREVRVTFRGLRDLNVVQDELVDGAELAYEESSGVSEDQLLTWLRAKDQLSVFSQRHVMKSLNEAGFSRNEIEGKA
jgi:hypothetical protein